MGYALYSIVLCLYSLFSMCGEKKEATISVACSTLEDIYLGKKESFLT